MNGHFGIGVAKYENKQKRGTRQSREYIWFRVQKINTLQVQSHVNKP